jgi:large subunit ribosomal protein L13
LSERDPKSTLEAKELSVRTYSPKASEITHDWYVIDAANMVLGRVAAHAAALLRGKHKPTFAQHLDTGDFVIIINAEQIVLTGSKSSQKFAYRHSGFPGGLTAVSYDDLLEKNPERAIEKAIRGMIPKNRLGEQQFSKLKVYRGAEHPHAAQQPKPFVIDQIAQ